MKFAIIFLLVAQLDSDKWVEREKATLDLIKLNNQYDLRADLKQIRGSPEQQKRLNRIEQAYYKLDVDYPNIFFMGKRFYDKYRPDEFYQAMPCSYINLETVKHDWWDKRGWHESHWDHLDRSGKKLTELLIKRAIEQGLDRRDALTYIYCGRLLELINSLGGLMKTHYFRTDLGTKQIVGNLNSIVYNSLPADQLVTLEDGVRLIASDKDAPNEVKNARGYLGVLKSLVSSGYVKEVIGVHLLKFVESKF